MKVIFTFLVLLFSFLVKGFHSPNRSSNEHSLTAVHAVHNKTASEFDELSAFQNTEDLFVSDNDDDELTSFKKKAQFLRAFSSAYVDFPLNYIYGSIVCNSARHESFCLPSSERCVALRVLRI